MQPFRPGIQLVEYFLAHFTKLNIIFKLLKGTKSRIGLADPDPSSADKEMPKHKKSTVEGGETVTFTPDDVRPRKKKKSQEYVIEQKTEL